MGGKDFYIFLSAVLLFWLVVIVAIASAIVVIGHSIASVH